MGRFKGEIRNFLFVGVAVFLMYAFAFLVMVFGFALGEPPTSRRREDRGV
jgi:hypothetical protein